MIGYHLMLDGVLNKDVTRGIVEEILSSLPAEIDMKILEGPIIVEGLPGNPGWTGFVIIDKSHISIHTFEEGDKISIDVYSCKPFKKDVVEEYLMDTLPLKSYNLQFIKRSEEKDK
ncbi:MAG: S-adenosylmethionine decarboxylase [Candidatus Bathyarchaeia archaeon]